MSYRHRSDKLRFSTTVAVLKESLFAHCLLDMSPTSPGFATGKRCLPDLRLRCDLRVDAKRPMPATVIDS